MGGCSCFMCVALSQERVGVDALLRRLFGRQENKTPDEVKLEESLQKSRNTFFGRLGALFQENEITEELWDQVEETLIRGDVGMNVTMELVERSRSRVQRENIKASR